MPSNILQDIAQKNNFWYNIVRLSITIGGSMPENTNITIRLSINEKSALQKYAEEHDLTMS